MEIVCWLKGLWRSIISLNNIDGHDYKVSEMHENCAVMIDKCEVCGKTTINWIKMDNPGLLDLRKQYKLLEEI